MKRKRQQTCTRLVPYNSKSAFVMLPVMAFWLFASPVSAQTKPPPTAATKQTAPLAQNETTSKSEDELKAARALEARLAAHKEQEATLKELEASIALSRQRQQDLQQEVARIASDRQTIQTDLIATAERIKILETSLTDRESRLKILFEDQTALRVSLAEQRDSLSEILAALQRIGRNPPPALAIRPGDALDSVRSAILLSTLVPEIRIEAQSLAAQLEELILLQKKIEEEKGALRTNLAKLGEERKRLDLLQIRKRKEQEKTQEQASGEQDKIEKLALEASGLKELITAMEKEIEAARLAVKEAQDAEKRVIEQEIKTRKQKIAALKNAARLSPAIPFPKMKGLLRLPAQGSILKAYGTKDDFGGTHQGLSITTRQGAQITSPADGWIVYSGPFRSFGKLLIINAGDGYHIVLAGLDQLTAQVGDFVLANEPVGQMQQMKIASTNLLDSTTTGPVLYMELRRDGDAINPAPWWTF